MQAVLPPGPYGLAGGIGGIGGIGGGRRNVEFLAHLSRRVTTQEP